MTAGPTPPSAPKIPPIAPPSGKKRPPPPETKRNLTVRLTKWVRSSDNPSEFNKKTLTVSINRHPNKRYYLVKDGSQIKLVSSPKANHEDTSDEILAPASPDKISSDDDGSFVPGTPPELQGRKQL